MLNIVKGAFGGVDGEQPEYEITMVGGRTLYNEKDQQNRGYFCHLL